MRVPFNDSHAINQKFGDNPESYSQFGLKGHNGIDYNLPSGTPVVAAESGKVVLIATDPPGFGNYIEIVGQYKTTYAHLNHATVAVGQSVAQGQQIGISDNTGNSSGPHLHFGVKPLNPDNNNGYLGAIDPQPIIDKGDGMLDPADQHLKELGLALQSLGPTWEAMGDSPAGVISVIQGLEQNKRAWLSAEPFKQKIVTDPVWQQAGGDLSKIDVDLKDKGGL